MAKTVDLKAVNVQLEADKAGLEASARKKNNALGNISCMWLEAQGLPNGGAVGPAAASPHVGQSDHKRSHDGNGIANAMGKKQKTRRSASMPAPALVARARLR
ncbi:TPA: hypothetical protein ACH3X2_005796 [Trebouxia sp. C0005]